MPKSLVAAALGFVPFAAVLLFPPQGPPARPVQEPAKVANPMASFARMIPGEWRVTAQSGTSMFHTWHWGPGKHSIRRMTDGSNAAGNPWRELQVFYWHPGRKQVCLLGLSPFARGVSEGTIKFEGEAADAVFDLYQTGGRRNMGQRWAFDGPDKYHETLLEATGPAGLTPLAEWDQVRSKTLTAMRTADEAPKPSERLKVLESLLGHTWEAKGNWATRHAFHIQSTLEWVPYADGIYARMFAQTKDGEPRHLLDAYFYHHTGTDALRCLALSNQGGVYEGDLTVLDGGALQLDLKGDEGDRVVRHVVRFDFEKDGTLRHRVWSLKGTDRTLMLDVHHKKLEPKKD
ncbi:MAG: putative transposase [Planctomycetota bacterium]|nr:putative transposase [Planctomycetota bacterium]